MGPTYLISYSLIHSYMKAIVFCVVGKKRKQTEREREKKSESCSMKKGKSTKGVNENEHKLSDSRFVITFNLLYLYFV